MGTPSEGSTTSRRASDSRHRDCLPASLPPCLPQPPQPSRSQPSPPRPSQAHKPHKQSISTMPPFSSLLAHRLVLVTREACHYRQPAQHILHYAVIVPPLLCTPHLASSYSTKIFIEAKTPAHFLHCWYDCSTCPHILPCCPRRFSTSHSFSPSRKQVNNTADKNIHSLRIFSMSPLRDVGAPD